MAVVGLKSPWINDDGLAVYWPSDAGIVTRGGEEDFDGKHRTVVFIDLGALPTAASGNEQIQLENCVIPSGAFIEKVVVTVTAEPATSGSPNLDLGFVKVDRSTEYDFNGLLAAADAFETGTDLGTIVEYTKGTTEAGALVGTVTTQDGIITASADTADWTAGQIRVEIYWSIFTSADTTA